MKVRAIRPYILTVIVLACVTVGALFGADRVLKVIKGARLPCDLNGDGKCDSVDLWIFRLSFGSCRGHTSYNSRADADADGCVTTKDERLLFALPQKDRREVYQNEPAPGARFNDIPPIIPNKVRGSAAMTGTNLLCDVNGDGKCDAADGAAVHAAVGSCRGSALFDPRFDVNGDGCITAEDEHILFPVPGDLNGDQRVDCTDLAIVKASFGKKAGEPGFDFRADVNRDRIVDTRDLKFVAKHLPAAIRCP